MPGLIARYRGVLGAAPGPVAGYLLHGVSMSLKPLAAVFLLREAGRAFDLVGLVLAAEVVGAALGMLLQGRLIDRFGARAVLLPVVLAHVGFLLSFLAAVRIDASLAVIVGFTFAWGFTNPVLVPSLRALWGTLFQGEERETAYATQAVLTEVVFVLGPVLASVVSLAVSPSAAVVLAAVLSLVGVALFSLTIVSRTASAEQVAKRSASWFSALSPSGMKVLLIVAGLSGVMGGAIEILLPVFAENDGRTELAGVGFAVLAIGSIVGGVIYGARRWGGSVSFRLALLTGALGVALLPLVVADGFLVACVVLLIAGAGIAPAEACLYGLIDDAADDATVVEANSWITAIYTVGLGAGTAAGGVLVERLSLSAAAVLPAAAALVSAVVIVLFVRSAPEDGSAHAAPPAPLSAT